MVVVEGTAAEGPCVGLVGFEPLVTDVLMLALARRGVAASDLHGHRVGGRDPDIVVAGLDHNSLDRLEELRADMPHVPIVAVVHSPSGPLRQVARRSGVAAVLVRSDGLARLREVLDLVLAGEPVLLPDAEASSRLGGLTAREITVLRMVAGGATNAEIGTTLGISPHTARTHVQKVMAKLGVRTRLGAGVAGPGSRTHHGGT